MPKKQRKHKVKVISSEDFATGFSKADWYGKSRKQRVKKRKSKNKQNKKDFARTNQPIDMPTSTDNTKFEPSTLDSDPNLGPSRQNDTK